MAIYIIPEIGAKGKFLFSAPFSNNTTADTEFECMAVRTLTAVVNSGEDGYTKYYKPNGLTQQEFNADVSEGISLVSLLSGDGRWLHVPNNRIQALPDPSGVRYQMMVLSLNIGAIDETMDTTNLVAAVKDMAFSYVGVPVEAQLVAVSQPSMVPQEDHERILQARANKIANNPPAIKKMETLQAAHNSLLDKYSKLAAYVAQLKKEGKI
jgi:hypothetical protein